jgi:2-dehydropantoate 2-reductase
MQESGQAIGIIGAGSVGSILAAHFAKFGRETFLVESGPRYEQIVEQGLRVRGKVEIDVKPTQVVRNVEDLGASERARTGVCFICTKTWSLSRMLPALQRALSPNTIVISFQNGIGPEEEIAKYFGRERIGRAIVNFAGGASPQTGEVHMSWFNPPNYIGVTDGDKNVLQDLTHALNEVGLTTELIDSHEIKKKVFFKTILNSALNALCAANGITMRQAMTYPHTRNLARVLIREGLSVASAVGYNYGEQALSICMDYLDQGGDHLPSMWTDLKNKNPTEIEYINGKIVKIGLMFKNVDVDVNRFFTSLIVTQEIKTGARDPNDVPDYLVYG